MIATYKHKNVTWVDIEKPTRNEILQIIDDYKIPKSAGEELLTETLKSKIDYYERNDVIYLVLHFPIFDSKERVVIEKEIDFILGKDYIITTHYQEVDPFNNFSRVFENESLLERNNLGQNPGFLFYYMLKHLYKYLDSQLDGIAVNLEQIENDIYNGHEQRAVSSISYTNRRIIKFRKAISFHDDIIHSIERVGTELYGSGFSFNMSQLNSEYNKVNSTIAWYKEMLNDMRDTNDTLLTTKTNETIKTLTIMTFIMLPITLITGIFGMNVTTDIVLIQSLEDFFLVIGAMVLTGLTMFAYFKTKKWL